MPDDPLNDLSASLSGGMPNIPGGAPDVPPELAAMLQGMGQQPPTAETTGSPTGNLNIQPQPNLPQVGNNVYAPPSGPPKPGGMPLIAEFAKAMIQGQKEPQGLQPVGSPRPPSRLDAFESFIGNFLSNFASGLQQSGTGPGANMRGMAGAMQAPYQRNVAQYQMQQQQQASEAENALKRAQAANLQSQSELVDTPWGKMPAKLAASMMGQYVKGGEAADTAAKSRVDVANINAAAKVGAMSPFGKLTPEMAAVGMPPDWKDKAKYPGGLKDPNFQRDVQTYGAQVSGLKQKNIMAQIQARGQSLAQNRAKYMQVGVLDSNTQTPTFASMADIASDPGRYTPLVEGDKLMMKNAIFEDIKGAATNLRSALMANPQGFSAGQIAKMTAAMRDDPSGSLFSNTVQNLSTAGAKDSLSPQQRAVAIAMAQAYENAFALRGVAGFGQGSDQLRDAIRATLPGPSSPTGYALQQLSAFEQQVDRLQRGVPKVRIRDEAGPGGSSSAPEKNYSPGNPFAKKKPN